MSNDWRGGVMESTDEVTRKTLELLQSSDFAKELEQFNAKYLKPTMNIMAKKIVATFEVSLTSFWP